MNRELVEKLKTDFPRDWFENRRPIARIECGDGWYQILHEFFQEIAPLVQDFEKFSVLQIKEKFGSLSIYVCGMEGDDLSKVYEQIRIAVQKSSETCECCGDKSSIRENDSGWLSTRCDLCKKHFQEFGHGSIYCPYIPWFNKDVLNMIDGNGTTSNER